MTERKKTEKSALAAPAPVGRVAGGGRRISSHELFGHNDQIVIEHGGREYHLRVTSNGKLILTA